MTEDLPKVELGEAWVLEDLVAIAKAQAVLHFGDAARERVGRARAVVDRLADEGEDAPNVYGVNTGFGALAETRVPADKIERLQRNLVRSHACGVGPDLPRSVARAMTALRAQTLALGHSGVRAEVVELLVGMLKRGVHPCIPAQGSVGASGDLAPLAHLALVLIGEGEAELDGARMPGGEALSQAGLEPVTLKAKEGLALINGTQMMMAVGALAVVEADALCREADIVGAMSLDALKGSSTPFDPRIQAARPHPGQSESASNLRRILADSQIMASHTDCDKVQDPYSLRCMPQVHGATRDALRWVRQTLEREFLAATDNPLIFCEESGDYEIMSGGNFHGQPIAIALDTATMAVAELGNISERRIEQLVNPAMSSGLPPFLAPDTGLDSGYMIAQVTAAALVSENKVLAHPSSVDSIPSSAGKEDHVSMGSISSRKLADAVRHVRTVLAIEGMVAAQGLELRGPLRGGVGVSAALACVRSEVPPLEGDRVLYPDIRACEDLLKKGKLREAVQGIVGALD